VPSYGARRSNAGWVPPALLRDPERIIGDPMGEVILDLVA